MTAFTDEDIPGRRGPSATTEADPREVGRVRTEYSPAHDGDPDPGEIVWTWVPFEENDGRGKDRPVLVVAREAAGTFLAVQLSSKRHDGDREWVWWDDARLDEGAFPRLGADLEATGAVRIGLVGEGTGRLMRQRTAVDFAVDWLARNRRTEGA